MATRVLALLMIVASFLLPTVGSSQTTYDPERWALYLRHSAMRSHRSSDSYLEGGLIEPHWLADGNSFWYAEGPPDSTVIYRVNPVGNRKTELFDTSRLREALRSFL